MRGVIIEDWLWCLYKFVSSENMNNVLHVLNMSINHSFGVQFKQVCLQDFDFANLLNTVGQISQSFVKH